MENPYQPPPATSLGELSGHLTLPSRLPAAQKRWMIRSLKWMRAGFALMTLTAIAALLETTLYPFGTRDVLRMIVVTSTVAAAIVMVGLIFSSLVRELRPRFLPRTALALTVIGTTVSTFFFLTVIDRGTVGGLFRLFGATAFATLLMGLVVVALLIRRVVHAEVPHSVTKVCDIAIIGYATCGGCYSALAMGLVASASLFQLVMWVSGITAVATQLFATETAVRWWTKP